MEILYNNETKYDVNFDLIKQTVKHSLEYEHFTLNTEISITIVSLEDIHQINLQHRGIDRPTDVLSFPLIDFNKEEIDEDSKIFLGDIVICYEKVLSQSQDYGHSVERELAFLTAHSMLHLMGYDHMVQEEEKIMFKKQEDILSSMGLVR